MTNYLFLILQVAKIVLKLHILFFRESEGTFQYGNYRREADDLHSVIQHFRESNRVTRAILGHSKGILPYV